MYSQAFHRLVCIGSHSYPRAVPCSPRSRMHHFHHYSHNLCHSSSNLVQLPAAHRKFILLPRANQRNNSFHYHLPHSKKNSQFVYVILLFVRNPLLYRTFYCSALHPRARSLEYTTVSTHAGFAFFSPTKSGCCAIVSPHTHAPKKENKFLLFHSVARSRTPVE